MRKEMFKTLKKIARRVLKKYGAKYSIVFGSFSKGYSFEESDLDIAVKLDKSPDNFKEKIRKMNEIGLEFEKELGIETDVIILNDANTGLKFEIFRSGRVLHYEDYNELVEDKAKVIAEYHDFNFWCDELYKKMLEGFDHGRK